MDLLEVEAGGVVFVWGRATWCWDAGDVVSRRLAAVQMVGTAAARHGEVMAAFGVTDVTLRAWRRSYGQGGVEALVPRKRGPRGPSKLNAAKVDEIVAARARGASLDAVAAATGVSRGSVSRALAAQPSPARARRCRHRNRRGRLSLWLVPSPATMSAKRPGRGRWLAQSR